jgi:dimethylhistidine N-methyltransferase
MPAPLIRPVAPERIRTGFAQDAIAGLTRTPKRLSPKYFYDEEGSRLFARITEQPEYYLTRAELSILNANAAAMTALFPPDTVLVEFGIGLTAKGRVLLEAAQRLGAYVPVDIAPEVLAQQALEIGRDFPGLPVFPVTADFTQLFELPVEVHDKPRVGFFPGSTIGNFEPHEACAFLQRAARVLGPGALLIIGYDLVKDSKILNAAYNDAAGVTRAFNLNILRRINRELGANFVLPCFEHHAFFNREQKRIEMHLASLKRQKVRVDGETIDFRAGETIHTENSYKYSTVAMTALARGAGWNPVANWTDEENLFAVQALKA